MAIDSMNTLSRDALRWMDALWDPSANLLWYEASASRAEQPRRHMVRESCWYALGLCMRNAAGDVARANTTVGAVLSQQYHAPGAIWHGTWSRAPEDAAPVSGALIWRDYDPNWRQFVGATLLILWRAFPELLSVENKSRIAGALRAAVSGEPAERVDARYTNIAMLRAWLEVEAGELLHESTCVARGEALAAAVLERYGRCGALDEFNSPTYYGVDLLAAALWARQSRRLAVSGARIEAMLWQDIANFYHAGLQNLCGPYVRAYGVDLAVYVGLISLWLRQIDDAAPLPPINVDLKHGHDLCLAPFIELLGVCVPALAKGALSRFGGERQQLRRLPGGAIATAWLSDELMIGGLAGSRITARDQFHPATVHWVSRERAVAESQPARHWLRLRSDGPLQASAARGELRLAFGASQRVRIENSCGAAVALAAADALQFPGLRIVVAQVAAHQETQTYRMQFALQHEQQ